MTDLLLIGISYFFTILAMMFVFHNISDKPFKLLPILIFSFIASVIDLVFYVYNCNILITIFNFLYFVMMIKVIYKENINITMFYSILIWIASLILDIIIMTLSIFIDFNGFRNDISKIISTIFLVIILILISKSKFIKRNIIKLRKSLEKINFHKIYTILIIISYFLFDIICFYNIEIKNFSLVVILISLSFLLFIFLFLIKQYTIYNLKITRDFLEKNNEQSMNVLLETRIFRHNFKNQLIGLKTVANKKTCLLIDDLINYYNNESRSINVFTNIPNGINGIVYEKLSNIKLKDLNISIQNKIDKNLLNKIGSRNYNLLCEALGVTLDNAIEATMASKEKILNVDFKENKDMVIVKIINSYSNTIDLDNLGNINYSSKGNGHGIGLFSLISRKKINIKCNLRNNLFITTITINKKNSSSEF